MVKVRVQFPFVTSYTFGLHDYIINQNTLLWLGNYNYGNVVYIYNNTLAISTFNYQVHLDYFEIYILEIF